MKVRINCRKCGRIFWVPSWRLRRVKYCTRLCTNRAVSRNSAQKRGDSQRYRGNGKCYPKYQGRHVHRVIAEMMLGRKLRRKEVVHHINGDIHDNRPSNLQVFASQSDHAKHHFPKGRKGRFHATKRTTGSRS